MRFGALGFMGLRFEGLGFTRCRAFGFIWLRVEAL